MYNMGMYYRRNADDDIRELERLFYQGDPEALPRLVAAHVRAGSMSLNFLIQHPEAFQYLPVEWQQTLGVMTGAIEAPAAQQFAQGALALQEEVEGALCDVCQLSEHDMCPMVAGCPCCQDTAENSDEDDEDEDEDEEERDEGDAYECVNCGDSYWADTENDDWAILTEASAAVTNAQIGRGEAGRAMCEDCLNQAGLDLEEAVQETLEDYCMDCGEPIDDCSC